LLRWLLHRRLGQVWYVPWAEIGQITAAEVTVRSHRKDLKPHEEMARY
jgi:hypothetical protein